MFICLSIYLDQNQQKQDPPKVDQYQSAPSLASLTQFLKEQIILDVQLESRGVATQGTIPKNCCNAMLYIETNKVKVIKKKEPCIKRYKGEKRKTNANISVGVE